MRGCIYLITCLKNGRKYVGKTVNSDALVRYEQHWYSAKHRTDKSLLHADMRRYGRKNFTLQTLCTVSQRLLDKMEAKAAEEYQTYVWCPTRGYNMVWCGNRKGLQKPKPAEPKPQSPSTNK